MATKKKAKKAYSIVKRRDGRTAVRGKGGHWITGFEKAEILFKEKVWKTKPNPAHYNIKVEAPAPVAEETEAAA